MLVDLSAEFPQLVSAMRISSGKCLKFVQIALLYKLDVIYLKSISNEVSVPSSEKITLVDMYQKSRYRIFYNWLGKLSSAFKPYGCKVLVFLSRSLHVSLTRVMSCPYLCLHCLIVQSR